MPAKPKPEAGIGTEVMRRSRVPGDFPAPLFESRIVNRTAPRGSVNIS